MEAIKQSLLVDVAQGICTLTLNRPAKKNALDTALMALLLDALRAAREDKRIRVLVLAASGDVFSAGADLSEFIDGGTEAHELRQQRTELLRQLLQEISHFPVPTLSVLNGHALGGGAAIALSTDMALMSETAKIGFPEVKLGIVPELMVSGLFQKVGSRLAYQLLLTAEAVPAAVAQSMGLVNKVVPASELDHEARQLTVSLCSLDRDIAIATKLAIRSTYGI